MAISSYVDFTMDNLIFTATDPHDSSSWSLPSNFSFVGYDPSLFWDDDGTEYLTGTAIALATIDTSTGALCPISYPYNGTGRARTSTRRTSGTTCSSPAPATSPALT